MSCPPPRRWLAGALLAGFTLCLAQQVRGAHCMSHTFWTAWLCWAMAALVDRSVSQLIAQKPSHAQAQVPALAGPGPLTPAE